MPAHDIRVHYDANTGVVVLWLQDPTAEPVIETVIDGVTIVRNLQGRVLGVRILHPAPANGNTSTTMVHTQSVTTSTTSRVV